VTPADLPPQIRQGTVAKARTLIEALPFMREHRGKVIVIKYGGAAMDKVGLAKPFADDIALLSHAGISPVIVHGGGPQVTHYSARLGIETTFVGGVRVTDAETLDVATMVQGNASPLPENFEVTAAHLEQAAKRQHVVLRKGDTVFIRTGWGPFFKSNPSFYAGDFSPGPQLDAAEYLISQGARVVGNDTLTFEKRPPVVTKPKFQVFPVHMRLIADKGVYIIENLNLEELAAAKAYEFAVVVPPLKVSGGTGSAVRIFALVPRDD